jgi:hypothetical protein
MTLQPLIRDPCLLSARFKFSDQAMIIPWQLAVVVMPQITRQIWTRHLRLPFGNLLGVVLLCLMLAPIFLSTSIFYRYQHLPRWGYVILLVLVLLGPLSAVAIDFRWRLRQPDAGKYERWLSPFEGATLIIFPVWLVATALLLAMLFTMIKGILVVTHHLHG